MSELALPTIKELVELADTEKAFADNNLMVLLNQPPPPKWVKEHPFAKLERKDSQGNKIKVPLPYLPAERVEYLLTRIFTKWWLEIKSTTCIANSVVVVVRLYVVDPITGEERWNDGVGAVAIQTDSGAGAMDWNKAKANGVQLAAPAAETYAFKDAAEKFGKIFGKDISRAEQINYTDLLVNKEAAIDIDELRELLDLKRDSMPIDKLKEANRIINSNEVRSFAKLKRELAAI